MSDGNVVAAALALVATAFASALAFHVRRSATDVAFLRRIVSNGLLVVPGAMVLYFSFSSGGFFPDAPAFVALFTLVVLILWTTLAEQPFAAVSRGLAFATGALALYTVWILASALWSGAPSRALIEADRSLVYLLTLVLFGCLPRSSQRLSRMLQGVALAMVIVCTAGLLTRVLPDVFPSAIDYRDERLSHPLTYWNAVGMMAALAGIFCLHLTTSLSVAATTRVLAAAAAPIVYTTLYLTFSRGAIAAGLFGAVLYMVLGRPRGLLTGVAAVVPFSIVAVVSAYRADLLSSSVPTTVQAVEQGRSVAIVVAACVLGAALIRAVLLTADRRLARLQWGVELTPRIQVAGWGVALLSALALAVGLDLPQRLSEQSSRFFDTSQTLVEPDDPRDRLDSASSNGRVEHWLVGLRAFEQAEIRGLGAGTFGLTWAQGRPPAQAEAVVRDAHSVYVENLAELGVVGLALLVSVLATILVALVPIRRGADRCLYAALFAGALAWLLHAGVDWDWEMPAITVWLFAVGGLALARRADRPPALPPSRQVRVAVGLAAVLTAVGPGLVLLSENRLDRAIAAYERGDCDQAIADAASAIAVLDIRPESYEVIGFCQSRRGFHRLAADAMARAVELDPSNWELHYGLAVVRGAGGMDPRAAAGAALRLNPRDPVTLDLVEQLARRRDWIPVTTSLALRQGLSAVR